MKTTKKPFLVIVSILSIVTVFMWIVFGVIRTVKKPTPTKVPEEILEPVSPTLDTQTLQSLDARYYFSEFDLITTQLFVPDIIDEEEEIVTPVEEIPVEEETNLENATESGNL